MNGREPWLSAAETLLRESGCSVTRWRTSTSGVADVKSDDWDIEAPEPRGPISYVTFAHEVAHQMLHRPGNGRPSLQRWHEELEAWLWALDTFRRFDLPGIEEARVDAARCLNYAFGKALRRTRTDENREALAQRIVVLLPEWLADAVAPIDFDGRIESGRRYRISVDPTLRFARV